MLSPFRLIRFKNINFNFPYGRLGLGLLIDTPNQYLS